MLVFHMYFPSFVLYPFFRRPCFLANSSTQGLDFLIEVCGVKLWWVGGLLWLYNIIIGEIISMHHNCSHCSICKDLNDHVRVQLWMMLLKCFFFNFCIAEVKVTVWMNRPIKVLLSVIIKQKWLSNHWHWRETSHSSVN